MGFYALVSADFPGASVAKRKEIDECLGKKHWRKLPNVSTTYCVLFKDSVSKEKAKEISLEHFEECASPGLVTLVVHIGDERPLEFP